MSLIDTPALRMLTASLDVNAFRQKVIASNIANVDTPGYRTRDIDFRRTLANLIRQADSSPSNGLDGANSFEESGPAAALVAHAVKGLIERPDGNNVSADREGLLLADTQLRFTLSAQLTRAAFHQLLSAIREGAA